MRIVFDSNVYLAAVKRSSYSDAWLKSSRPNGPYQLFISPEILLEVRTKLESRFSFTTEQSAESIKTIMLYATIVYPSRRVEGVLSDADDHKILECALEAKAHVIITSDRGLLKLKEFENIKIAHPSMLKYWFTDQKQADI